MTQNRFFWMGKFLMLPEALFSASTHSTSLIEVSFANFSRLDSFFGVLSFSVERGLFSELLTTRLRFSLQRRRQPDGTFRGFGVLFETMTQPSLVLLRYEYVDRLEFLFDCWRRSGWPMQTPRDY